ncbi:MAG: glycolate oxidase subunit GlcF [Gammaproteobacteria bacterium]|nr:glycolate oxidase subunit GlcF [Gammaproteobacteria bacterium]
MQTALPVELLATDVGREADSILRACVHCGFCLATCPTYQVNGNELDSPRGRIYLIKEMLEGAAVTGITRTHLDRCLTCQSCETTCPSGVNYHRLLDIGRAEVEKRVPRALPLRLLRWCLVQLLSRRQWFTPALRLGRLFRPFLPGSLKHYLPPTRSELPAVGRGHARRMILVQGCVQPGLSPNTNAATRLVLDRLGIETVSVAGETCCGALAYHLSAQRQGLQQARNNIDAWWPLVEADVEAIVMTASGCSVFVKEYAHLLAADPDYADRARRVVDLLRDISEVLQGEELAPLAPRSRPSISWHCPCTAQHGQQLDVPTRGVLERLGFELPIIEDSHLCCGSAGTYSMLQPRMATELRDRKLANLQASTPEQIVTANIGCQTHLAGGTETPVVHWIELVARQLASSIPKP